MPASLRAAWSQCPSINRVAAAELGWALIPLAPASLQGRATALGRTWRWWVGGGWMSTLRGTSRPPWAVQQRDGGHPLQCCLPLPAFQMEDHGGWLVPCGLDTHSVHAKAHCLVSACFPDGGPWCAGAAGGPLPPGPRATHGRPSGSAGSRGHATDNVSCGWFRLGRSLAFLQQHHLDDRCLGCPLCTRRQCKISTWLRLEPRA